MRGANNYSSVSPDLAGGRAWEGARRGGAGSARGLEPLIAAGTVCTIGKVQAQPGKHRRWGVARRATRAAPHAAAQIHVQARVRRHEMAPLTSQSAEIRPEDSLQ
ncbi:hypothetical protein PSP6_800044 [Paraburkholderia tropica]|nr:hypothetical protein PSP6_800044 [Paraburkholderia tropica]